MTTTTDRNKTLALIADANQAGATVSKACELLEISPRTRRRWLGNDGKAKADQRPLVKRPPPANKLTEEERQQILDTANEAAYQSLPPTQIVPDLADKGLYIASESSFYRVLADANQLQQSRFQDSAFSSIS